ncbi:unnamed protein product [Schistosoma curassoni]|uniref:Uncharacterized protein n=1 Tax=Schistosoma curassoni TaxID=6186 RepID=A0A183K9L2_9TREM|nr:unnamed protein product [Schistosoma curassoni]
MAIRQIKKGKAAAPDNIIDEALKSNTEVTAASTQEDRQYHPEFIRRTTVQSGAWRTSDGHITSEDRRQTRLSTLSLPPSSDSGLDYEDLDIGMDGSE